MLGEAGTVVYKACVDLYERSAGLQHVHRIVGRHDPAHANDRQAPLGLFVDVAHPFYGFLRQWSAAQPAVAHGLHLRGGCLQTVTGSSGVHCHYAVNALRARQINYFINMFERKVGRQLEQNRNRRGNGVH